MVDIVLFFISEEFKNKNFQQRKIETKKKEKMDGKAFVIRPDDDIFQTPPGIVIMNHVVLKPNVIDDYLEIAIALATIDPDTENLVPLFPSQKTTNFLQRIETVLEMIRTKMSIPDGASGPIMKTMKLSAATAAKVGGAFDMLADQRIYGLKFELPCWSFKGKQKERQKIEDLRIVLTHNIKEKDDYNPEDKDVFYRVRDELLRKMMASGHWKYQGDLCLFTQPGDLTTKITSTSLQLGDIVRLNFAIDITIAKISFRFDPKHILSVPYSVNE